MKKTDNKTLVAALRMLADKNKGDDAAYLLIGLAIKKIEELQTHIIERNYLLKQAISVLYDGEDYLQADDEVLDRACRAQKQHRDMFGYKSWHDYVNNERSNDE